MSAAADVETPASTGEAVLARYLLERHPGEAARLLEFSPLTETAELLAEEPAPLAAELYRRLSPDRGAEVLSRLPDPVARDIVGAVEPNRAAALLARMDEPERESRLTALPGGLAEELRELMAYPPDTAGSLMDPRFVSFPPEASVREARRRLRATGRRRVQDVFLVGEDGLLVGVVPLTEIVLAQPGTRLDSLSQGVPVSVRATASRDEVIEVLQSRRSGTLPVVDFEGRLLGVLRQDELLTATEQDATADLVTMVGASREERALSPPWFAVRKRLPWLQINLLTAFLAASVVGLFEDTIARFTALAVLLPVVAGQSGNTGAQALAVTMRGLALREVRVRHWFRVSGKELTVGVANGVAVALTTSLAVFVWSRSPGLAAVIGLSMVLSMAIAGFSGAVIPMLLTALRQDPAQSSSIILTTVTDVAGFFSFLGIATLLASTL